MVESGRESEVMCPRKRGQVEEAVVRSVTVHHSATIALFFSEKDAMGLEDAWSDSTATLVRPPTPWERPQRALPLHCGAT